MGAMPGADITGPEDLSNTQYVLLALWAGTRHGFEIDPDVLESMADRLLAWQEADGPRVQRRWDPPRAPTATGYHTVDRPAGAVDRARGFGYTPGERPTGSMTTAGLSSLAILKAMLVEKGNLDPKLRMRIDTGIWDAIAWLARHFSVGENPNAGATWHYYYLYGLERACVIAGKTHLGERDWYREGAEMLIRAQKEDGRWSTGRFGPRGMGAPGIWMDLLDSCFALLFLKRAALEPTEPILPPAPITPSER
jgi:hypothetical protein